MQQPAVGGCLFCPGWTAQGTVEEIEELSREHRTTVHPDLKSARRRPRANLGRWRTHLREEDSLEVEEERRRRMRLLGIEPGNT